MFRVTHITSACGGIGFGALASSYERASSGAKGPVEVLMILAFFGAVILCVVGLPQWREQRERNGQRSALFCFRTRDFRQDLDLFYVPVWARGLTFMGCAALVGFAWRIL